MRETEAFQLHYAEVRVAHQDPESSLALLKGNTAAVVSCQDPYLKSLQKATVASKGNPEVSASGFEKPSQSILGGGGFDLNPDARIEA